MKTLKTVIATLIAIVALTSLVALGVIYSGAYNVAATDKHWAVTAWLLNKTVHQSIAQHAQDIEVPTLDSRRQVLAGAVNYEAMCAGCHAAPGIEQGLPGAAMYPQPPRLDHAMEDMTPAQLFWVIKHGIKASGMPAWGPSHSDEEIWSMVAFIRQLPQMSAMEYEQLQQAADASGMGHHHDNDNEVHEEEHMHPEESSTQPPTMPADAHGESGTDHGTDDHTHGADGHSH